MTTPLAQRARQAVAAMDVAAHSDDDEPGDFENAFNEATTACIALVRSPEFAGMVEDLAKLQAFADAVLDDWWETSFDGADIQDIGVKSGLLEPFTATEPCNPDNCACAEIGDFPLTCYRRSQTLRRAILAQHHRDAARTQGD